MEQVTKRTITVVTGAILTTLREVKWAPNGVVYAAVMAEVDFVTYTQLVGFLEERGLVSLSWNVLTLTPTGEQLADRIALAMARGR